ERNRPPDGAAIADRRMRDVGESLCDERRQLRDQPAMLGLGVARQGAKLELSIALGDLAELGNPVDIDQQRRGRQPHVECGHQPLPAGEYPGLGSAVEQRDRMVERTRLRVSERRRFHLETSLTVFVWFDSTEASPPARATLPLKYVTPRCFPASRFVPEARIRVFR